MVQILREQTRNYAADQSGTIREEQVAKNIGEWSDVIQGVGKIATSVMDAQKKAKQEADDNMINTESVSRLGNDLRQWNVDALNAGADPSSEEHTKNLYAKRDELFQPYIDQMQSEKGRSLLQKRSLEIAESIRTSNIGKIGKVKQQVQARKAFVDVVGNVQNDAREFGKIGDWQGFKEATDSDRAALKKYAKANNIPEYQIDMNNIKSFALGQAESEPEEIIKIFGTEADYKEIKRAEQKEKMKDPNAAKADEFADSMTDWRYRKEDIEKYSRQKRLEMLPEEAVKQAQDAFVFSKKQEKLELEKQINALPKGSTRRNSLEKKRDEIQGQIDDPEKYVVDMLTEDIRKAVVPIAKQQYEKNRLLEKKIREDNVKEFYTMPLNPDSSVSFQAQMAAALGQPEVEDLFQMSVSNEEMHKAYNDWAESKTSASTRQYATFEATQAVADKMYNFLHNTSDDEMVMYKDGLELLTEINKAALTQDQKQDLNNIMYGVFKDRGFADLAARVLEDNNKYFPDIPLVAYGNATSGSHSLASEENKGELGLLSADTMMTDIDSVKAFLDKESLRISKDCIGMLALAAQLPTAEERSAQVDKIAKYVADEKQKAYDEAMKTYGIDLGKLRKNKQQFGQAFTTLGTMNPVEYMGDDPYSGQPLFRPLTDYQQIQNARQRILESANYVKAQLGKKEE